MKGLRTFKKPVVVKIERTADELLAELCKYGRPSVFQFEHNLKWLAKITLDIRIPGTDFQIKGKGETPNEALLNCLENLQVTRRALVE